MTAPRSPLDAPAGVAPHLWFIFAHQLVTLRRIEREPGRTQQSRFNEDYPRYAARARRVGLKALSTGSYPVGVRWARRLLAGDPRPSSWLDDARKQGWPQALRAWADHTDWLEAELAKLDGP